MTPNRADLVARKQGHTLIRVNDSIGFNNYVVVNEETKDYYDVSIAKNTTLTESVNGDIFYTIKLNGKETIKEDIYTVIPKFIIKSMINEVEEYVDSSNNNEVVDYMVDIFDELGYKPRHVIYYDNIEESLDYDFLVIVNGNLESVYISVSKNGDISIVDDYDVKTLIGNMENHKIVKQQLSNYFDSMEHFTAMVSEDVDGLVDWFNILYKTEKTDRGVFIYENKTNEKVGFIDRKNGVYKLNDVLSEVGYPTLRFITETIEVRNILNS